jgi:hypothetical protein
MSNKTFEPTVTVSKRHFLPSIFLLLLIIGLLKPALATEASKIPMTASRWQTKGDVASISQASTADYQAIETLLASYTRCVTEHDEAGFRALLLNEKIPFANVEESAASNNPPNLRQYEGFRQSVFASGQRFRQRFYNVRIEQHGALAQVSLNFVTEQGSGKRGSATGWKVLQLVKVGGRWKIASELYTFSRTPTGG